MKIDALQPTAQIHKLDEVRAPSAAAPTRPVTRDQVTLSADAAFLGELREAMSQMPEVRQDVVEQTRAELAAGTIGNETDLERAVDALLMEL